MNVYVLYLLLLIVIVGFVLLKFVRSSDTVEQFLEFIHIPKNAGTTIENIAKDKGVKWGRFNPDDRNYITEGNCTYWHIPPKYFRDGSKYENDETFCVMRDPYQRIISEYAYRHKNMPEMDNKTDLNIWLQEHLTDTYVKKGKLNCHFVPQVQYMYNDRGNKTCDHVLNFNNLTDEFNTLMTKKDIDLKLEENKKDNITNFNLKPEDIDSDNRILIDKYYKDDINLWNSLNSTPQ